MPVRLLIQIQVQPGTGPEQVSAFLNLAPLVRAEAGCLKYELHQVVASPDRFVIDEEWATQADLDAHAESEHMIQADVQNRQFRTGPAIITELSHVH